MLVVQVVSQVGHVFTEHQATGDTFLIYPSPSLNDWAKFTMTLDSKMAFIIQASQCVNNTFLPTIHQFMK